MENPVSIHILLLVFVLPLFHAPVIAKVQHYVVYLGTHDGVDDPDSVTRSHHDMISSVLKRDGNDPDPSKRLSYSYTKAFNAFAATLHEEEADELAKHPDIISIFKDKRMIGYTTHSWNFLSSFQQQAHIPSSQKLLEKTKHGEDMIIANLDSGICPESDSFKDDGLGPIPKKFKGQCDNAKDPTTKCNRKLIGGRYFNKGLIEVSKTEEGVSLSLNSTFRDKDGHGTHTLSTAGGRLVTQVEEKGKTVKVLGMKNGTARGGAPGARVVAYKVLWPEMGSELVEQLGSGQGSDSLAGIESAIADGVDVINMSLGAASVSLPEDKEIRATYYFQQPSQFASFHAMDHNIPVVGAAMNSGPAPSTVSLDAPWLLTVGATSFGRSFICYISLGNGKKIKGARFVDNIKSMNETTFYPLITGTNALINGASPLNASYCIAGSVDPVKVQGKILVCLMEAGHSTPAYHKSKVAKDAGAAGLILANDHFAGFNVFIDDMHYVATAHITYQDGQALFSYIKSTRNPTATITSTTVETGVKPAPVVAYFSSRGPHLLTPGILKPDVVAPGVSVIAAFSEAITAQPFNDKYVATSGTSMATPHVTAIVALLKKLHPDWSPAAIKSSIMTTASPVDNRGKPILEEDLVHEATPFAIGAGFVQPELAMDPGLVYDMNKFDYLNFLCAEHYNSTVVGKFTTQHNYKCPKAFSIKDLNYPSITVLELFGKVTVTRRLKNVGQPGTYTAKVEPPHGISIVVEPKTLKFSKKNQEIGFKLVFSVADVQHPPSNDYIFGSLEWSNGKHVVRSPIVVKAKANVKAKATPAVKKP